ncbi:hypothetical protein ACFQ3N_07085 [Virgibacillus byunsanensis]|uniref:DUF4367 domain-containing protein n=1 Tax=Virgibacillus byunsanensis TaxID=570945 RepID=A0ABW3LIG3_9BACI
MNYITSMASVAFILLFIVGCSPQTEEDVLQDTKEAAMNTFEDEETIEANHEIDSFSFYLPNDLEVVEEDVFNVILEDGDQTYIVFYNNLESPLSELHYNSAKNDKSVLYESFKDGEKFGYIRVVPGDDEDYEIQIGVGGVKITTYTTLGDLDNEAPELMKIARSIAESEKK